MASTFARDLRTGPNLLSLSRIALALLAAPLYLFVSPALGLALGVVAAVTDFFDGALARATGQVTRLGEILDQFGDLCFESLMLLCAVSRGFFPAAVLYAYLFREFWVSSIRRFVAGLGRTLPSSPWGKLKTNLLMWGLLPAYVSMSGWLGGLEPYLALTAKVLVGLGLAASYLGAAGYTRAFVSGYEDSAADPQGARTG
jgi:CDP-diacylglycerol--glycerol-3-phosphate 3-phosphatidyltransferase